MAHCPHADIRDCPLYVAAHDGTLGHLGCLGDWGFDWCDVDRGLDYVAAVAELRARAPRLVAIVEFNAQARAEQAQRERNRRFWPSV